MSLDLKQGRRVRTLEFCAPPHFGSYTQWSRDIQDLVDAGYMVGNWMGSLEYDPYPCWTITREGEKALKEFKRNELVANTQQCTKCTYAYGEEVYLVAYCTVCGRQIKKEPR